MFREAHKTSTFNLNSARDQRAARLGILGSGKGSNFRVLVEASRSGLPAYEPIIVLSDVADAGILKLADQFQMPSHFVAPGPFKTKMTEAIEQEMVAHLQAAKVDFIALAGFMRVIKEPLLKAFPGRILNIHPSLLPQFPGLAAWQQAYEAKVSETGCTVHLVDEGIDTGKILGQSRVPVLPNDTLETLHARIQEAEHELYPRIVNQFAEKLIAAKECKECEGNF
ncbi:MAG: phosphoribosylglycinamide formyltransferase [Verrucomicrobia bacterium]|nr:phosphoribosylglycinamide formyltransferase [Verrucomicrobiota bacterium]